MFPRDRKLTLLTAYDFLTAQILEKSKIDAILVGDSLGMNFAGEKNTHNVTIEQMCYHVQAVKRGASQTQIIGDMPINTYSNKEAALLNARKLIQNGADAVKLEGGQEVLAQVEVLIQNQIKVIGHIGLTPQKTEEFKVVGRKKNEAQRLLADALALAQSGVEAIVLECIPTELAQKITEAIPIPTIGIGAGKHCNGQILVFEDLVGLTGSDFEPKFLKRYANGRNLFLEAVKEFKQEVEEEAFPSEKQSY